MNITPFLFYKILLIRIKLTSNGEQQKEVAIIRRLKGKVQIEEFKDFKPDAFDKWKKNPVILLIIGEQIVSKAYDKNDLTLKRIMNNPEFLYDIENEKGEALSFLRLENISDFMRSVEQYHLLLLDTWIYSLESSYDLEGRLNKLYLNRFKTCTFWKSPNLTNALARLLFHKIFWPVLLFFFVLLLGNLFLHSYYTKEYQQKQSAIQQNKKEKRTGATDNEKQKQMLVSYNQLPVRSFALIADRIASYVPANLYLTSMNLFPLAKNSNSRDKRSLIIDYHTIRLKGLVETPGSVTLLSQLLETDNLFVEVKVLQLERRKNTQVFEFELEITL